MKVDGASIAAMEMSKEAMQKNASVLLNKAIKEREKIFTAILPSKFESLDKTKEGKYIIPVLLAYDKAKLKMWTENWLPVFEKMAIKTGTNVSTLNRIKLVGALGLGILETNSTTLLEFELEGTQNMIIILPISVTLGNTKNRWFLIPCKKSAVKWDSDKYRASNLCKLKLELSIKSKSGDDIFVSESTRFGNLEAKDYARPLAGSDNGQNRATGIVAYFGKGLHFPPFISCADCGNTYLGYYFPEKYGCIFEAEIANDDLPKIDKMTANSSWVYP